MTDHNRNDLDELLGELGDALNVQPSPEFEARVRERVATESFSTARWWWLGAAAVAATAVIVIIAMPRSGVVDDRAPVQDAQVERPAPSVEMSRPTEHVSAAAARPVARAAARRRTMRAVVPPGQEEAIEQLVAAMWSGQVQSAPRVGGEAAQLEVGTLAVPELIQMSTIRIDPLYEEF